MQKSNEIAFKKGFSLKRIFRNNYHVFKIWNCILFCFNFWRFSLDFVIQKSIDRESPRNKIDFQRISNKKLACPHNLIMNPVSLYFLALFVTFLHSKKQPNSSQNMIDFQKNIHPKTITHSKSENDSCFALFLALLVTFFDALKSNEVGTETALIFKRISRKKITDKNLKCRLLWLMYVLKP